MEQRTENKMTYIKKLGKETEINLFIVVELLRFVIYLWFILLIIVGVFLTIGFVEEDYRVIIKSIFGSVNLCVFFNFPPATYVLPTLYAIWPVLVFQYCIVSIFRAWIALEEKKISTLSFGMYTCTFIYTFCSSIFFATSIAVQPDLNKQETIALHDIPFTNLVIALTFLQIAITWFGFNVSWNGMKTLKVFELCTFISVLCLVLTSIMKVTQHINSIFSLEKSNEKGLVKVTGTWWRVEDESLGLMFQVIDVIWIVCIFLVPLIQSGYLSWRKFDTHGLVVTIGDNRTSNESFSFTGNSAPEAVTEIGGIEVLEKLNTGNSVPEAVPYVPEIGGLENQGYNTQSNFGGMQNRSNPGSAKSRSNEEMLEPI